MRIYPNRSIVWIVVLLLMTATGVSRADLADEFDGFTRVQEAGVSGLTSSYYDWAQSSPTALPASQEVLGSDRVSYPYGIGTVPSPGTSVARNFDEGALGVMRDGTDLVIKVAGGLDPETGFYYSGWNTWYGQGDVFLSVLDSTHVVRHYALLNAWARDAQGDPRTLDGGHFDQAQAFHTTGGESGSSLEGHLVRLADLDDIVLAGGSGAYAPTYSPPPEGLDYRVFAQGGTDLGDADLDTSGRASDAGLGGVVQTWYIQEWRFPMEWLSTDKYFTLGLHKAASCGNDQIGMLTSITKPITPQDDPPVVPAPGAMALGGVGLALVGWAKRNTRRRSA